MLVRQVAAQTGWQLAEVERVLLGTVPVDDRELVRAAVDLDALLTAVARPQPPPGLDVAGGKDVAGSKQVPPATGLPDGSEGESG